MSRTYDSVEFGEELPDLAIDAGMERITRFAKTTRMMAARFLDHDKAKKEGLPGAIVPGVLSQGILSSMIHNWAPGAEILKIDTIFRAPVLVDSKPTCRAVVTDMDDDSKTVEIDLTITNEAGENRVMGTATVRLA